MSCGVVCGGLVFYGMSIVWCGLNIYIFGVGCGRCGKMLSKIMKV